ncbi:MAG: biotin-dependent carboxyltransferase family protein, partial [Ilumatobacteraceae bacterium]
MTLLVEHVGFTTVQDAGRRGWAHLGVSHSGAADRGSFHLANRLLGNSSGAAVLESAGGVAVRATSDTFVVLTGAECDAALNDRPVSHCPPLLMRAGDLLRVSTVRHGVWMYLGVAGGIDGPEQLGSRSHDTLGNIVPLPLDNGSELEVGVLQGTPLGMDTPVALRDTERVGITAGPHGYMFRQDDLVDIFRQPWTVSGVRLMGTTVHRQLTDELHSFPLVRGAVQLTPAGELVVMLADHPTTGGYPVVGVVLPLDVDRLAQARAGARDVAMEAGVTRRRRKPPRRT